MKIFHTADWHLGCKTHGKRDPETGLNSRLVDAKDRIEDLAQVASEESVDLALFAGDGFEHPNPTPTQQRLFLNAIKEFDCPIIATTGNHDVPATEGRSHALDLLNEVEGVHLIDEPGVYYVNVPERLSETVWQIRHGEERKAAGANFEHSSGGAVVLTVLPWPLEHQAPEGVSIKQHYLNLLEEGHDRAQKLGIPAYAMGHFTISGSLPSGSEESLQLNGEVTFSPADFEGYDYAALGHIHQRQDLGTEDTPVVYPSCPMRKSFSEEGDEKGAVLIRDHREPQSYEHVSVEARPFVTVERDLRGAETPTKALAKAAARENTDGSIVRVRYRTGEDQPVDERAVEEALSGAHKIAAIERQVERTREGRTDSGLGADASTEELVREFAQSREIEEIEDDLVELTKELHEMA